MNNIPRQQLKELLEKYGHGLCDEPNKLEAMLRDLCPQYKREINLIISALKEKVAADFITSSNATPKEILVNRFAQRLYDNLGIATEFAEWAVESWALALGVIPNTKAQIQKTQKSPVPKRTVARNTTSTQSTLMAPFQITAKDIKWWNQLEEGWKRLLVKAIGINRQPNRNEFVKIINLQKLDCSTNEISSLEPINYLINLQKLDCSFNKISSLEPLQSLINLQELNCSLNILINNLEPLHNLRNLQHLNCSFSSIDSLAPIRHLTNLKRLDCQETPMNENEIRIFKIAIPQCEVIF